MALISIITVSKGYYMDRTSFRLRNDKNIQVVYYYKDRSTSITLIWN